MGVDGQCHALAALPPGKTLYALYRRLDGPQSGSEWVWKNLVSPPPLLGFDPLIIQPKLVFVPVIYVWRNV
jgi:hypothetical protein